MNNSSFPPDFGIQEQARYFGMPRDSYARRETLAERAHYTNDYDKHTDPEVIAWRNNYARKLRALRKAKHGL